MTDHDRIVSLEAEMRRLRVEAELQPQFWVRNLIRLAGLEQERIRRFRNLQPADALTRCPSAGAPAATHSLTL